MHKHLYSAQDFASITGDGIWLDFSKNQNLKKEMLKWKALLLNVLKTSYDTSHLFSSSITFAAFLPLCALQTISELCSHL